ncbi:MAG: hypothetical protein Q4P78_09020 [Rothia sp. (in: high G+C Gram-positive bacteria)]|uniref:hypothetical protein n=1 Tax=Rothia sp. (in: high G+C Gram-positive bacteria) TaxID=1885016 RepID=UPI0026E0526D|nr:hypothetical protein [Rothia sp. (in: high G+C Gram-positive bacteria)]MDO5751315.1 hypothetical protein [Rothia sp. (in: high G+C Gram-positive bacteria)]
MYWEYVILADDTQISYANPNEDGTLPISIERPKDGGFDSARCLMPSYRWSEIHGFTGAEIEGYERFLRNNAPLIFEFAKQPESERMGTLHA